MTPPKPDLHGILILDKPPGLTSMQAVVAVRRRAGGVKTGHAGTLDPLATGVLVLALGRATKIISKLMATDKHYRTAFDLSAFTNTDDREGQRNEIQIQTPPSLEKVQSALPVFIGQIEQRPPAFSAVKVGGQRSYKHARQGSPARPQPRTVTVDTLEIIRYDWPQLELDIASSKGFYVRSLARDLGETLGTGGHCAMIRRTAVGPFDLTMAVSLEQVSKPVTSDDLISIDEALTAVSAP